MSERRQYVRWQINRQAQCTLEGAVRPAECTVHDISFRGVRMSIAQKLPRDTAVRMKLVLCEEFGCLEIEMWLIWHRSVMDSNVYGAQFVKIKDSDKETIYKFLSKYHSRDIMRKWWNKPEPEGGEKQMEEAKVSDSRDRRIFERFSARFPLRFIDLKRNKEGQAEVSNVSAKGLGIVAAEPFTADTPLEMWLDIPDKGEPVYCRGGVVWCKSGQPGQQCCAGIDLEKADLMGLSRLLRTH